MIVLRSLRISHNRSSSSFAYRICAPMRAISLSVSWISRREHKMRRLAKCMAWTKESILDTVVPLGHRHWGSAPPRAPARLPPDHSMMRRNVFQALQPRAPRALQRTRPGRLSPFHRTLQPRHPSSTTFPVRYPPRVAGVHPQIDGVPHTPRTRQHPET